MDSVVPTQTEEPTQQANSEVAIPAIEDHQSATNTHSELNEAECQENLGLSFCSHPPENEETKVETDTTTQELIETVVESPNSNAEEVPATPKVPRKRCRRPNVVTGYEDWSVEELKESLREEYGNKVNRMKKFTLMILMQHHTQEEVARAKKEERRKRKREEQQEALEPKKSNKRKKTYLKRK